MKFKVTMKDPDTLQDAISDAVADDLKKIEGISDEEREDLSDERRASVAKFASKWFKWGEYVTVEIDTIAQTATVCPAE